MYWQFVDTFLDTKQRWLVHQLRGFWYSFRGNKRNWFYVNLWLFRIIKRYDGNSGKVAFILKIVFEMCSLNSTNSRHFVFNEICFFVKLYPKWVKTLMKDVFKGSHIYTSRSCRYWNNDIIYDVMNHVIFLEFMQNLWFSLLFLSTGGMTFQ